MSPKRIISAAILARRLAISQTILAKYLRRGTIHADYTSDAGTFFDPERIGEIRQAIAANRARQWRHVTVFS